MPARPGCSASSPACAASGNRSPGAAPISGSGEMGAAPQPTLLKSDIFGTITRVGDTVVRDARNARPWARPLARHLMRREHRALTRLALGTGTPGVPIVLDYEPGRLTRSWIEGAPMQLATPRDPGYFRAAARLLRRLHAANVIHNDLAKETNWLVTPAGRPALVDFQLAMTLRQRRTVEIHCQRRTVEIPCQ